MEGRWAQLAVDAHIAHAIDYSRPVNPLIEAVIFDRLEILRRLSCANLYPNVTPEKTEVMISHKWAKNLIKEITPWDHQTQNEKTKDEIIHEGIKFLKNLHNK